MKAYLVKIVKPICLGVSFTSLCLALFLLPVYLFPAGILIALVYLGMCYQLWYIPAFTGLVFGQSIGQTPRYGLDGGDHFSSLLLGLDRDLFGLSGHHKSS